MKDGDYIVAINEQDVKWSPHDQVVNLIKRSGNSLKLRLVTPLDKKEISKMVSEATTTTSSKTTTTVRGSSSPTSSASSTSGHSSGGVSGGGIMPSTFSHPSGEELSSSPASSVTSGSTRSHATPDKKSQTNLSHGSWNPFKKPVKSHHIVINDNIILR